MKTGVPGTDTNGVGVAGGLNVNADVDPTSSRAEARLSGSAGPVEQLRENRKASVGREADGCSARNR